jgi:hypothetical protein
MFLDAVSQNEANPADAGNGVALKIVQNSQSARQRRRARLCAERTVLRGKQPRSGILHVINRISPCGL